MANVLLGVTGSVAAIHTRLLFDELKQAGYSVKVVATAASLYFFNPVELDSSPSRNPDVVIVDEDEWPGRDEGRSYHRTDKVLHIELRRWADLLLIAPLDANTLAKLACGLSDNCLTCVWRAWDRSRPVVLAPAMNTLMWEHPFTRRHLLSLAEDFASAPPPGMSLEDAMEWIHGHCPALRIVAPVSKRLACDDVGVGALAERGRILEVVNETLRPRSPEASG